jgi:hypothetical protein
MDQIPVELLVSEESVRAGVGAMERIHGRHLSSMTPGEQEEARGHWRAQVEEILIAVREQFGADGGAAAAGRAVISFTDAGEDQVEIGAAFMPELQELPDGDVEGTPAQLLALSALESLAEIDGEDEPGPLP